MKAQTVLLLAFVFVLEGLESIPVNKRDVDLNPKIPTTQDDEFLQFQKAVAKKQNQFGTRVLFSDLNAYKSAFDSFKSNHDVNIAQSAPTTVDSNFAKFQKFIVKNMRQYKNFNELRIRYGLFLEVAQKMAGYNDGGDDLAGINDVSDKTLSEKHGKYG